MVIFHSYVSLPEGSSGNLVEIRRKSLGNLEAFDWTSLAAGFPLIFCGPLATLWNQWKKIVVECCQLMWCRIGATYWFPIFNTIEERHDEVIYSAQNNCVQWHATRTSPVLPELDHIGSTGFCSSLSKTWGKKPETPKMAFLSILSPLCFARGFRDSAGRWSWLLPGTRLWQQRQRSWCAVLMGTIRGGWSPLHPSEERPVITVERPVKLMAWAAYAAEVFPVILYI